MPSESFWANFLLQHVFFWSSFWIKWKTGKLHFNNKKQQMFDSMWFLLTIFDFSTLCVLVFSHMLGQMPFCELYGDMCTTEEANMISVRRSSSKWSLSTFGTFYETKARSLPTCIVHARTPGRSVSKTLPDFMNYIHQHFDFWHHLSKLKQQEEHKKQGNIPGSSSTKGSNSNIPLVPLTPLPRKRKAQQNQVNPSELTVQPSRRNGARAFHSRRHQWSDMCGW